MSDAPRLAALAALIADLYAQITEAQTRIAQLEAAMAGERQSNQSEGGS